ncbi:NUDIX domain-containing protein [uncultured Cohaesibacter sp.]|uniref:NUDIX domain-containing protein n=1 Tax=uncultured Cohaesibacter sp. TaxID=1002546 RepID=UPI00292F4FCB|nr:NUDIX domain-containing protein [uncultured Cohaesibacter sp.]
MIDIVNGLLIRQGQVLMALRSPQRKNFPNSWSFPGGHVEDGETLHGALVRELVEEIGVQATRFYPLDVLKDREVAFHLFVVEEWQDEIANLGDEHVELLWVDFDKAGDLPRLALPAYREVFEALKSL